MQDIFPQALIDLLMISVTFSFIMMTLIQKLKKLSFINKKTHIWIANFILSFTLAIPFGIRFYDIPINDTWWVGLFAFIGAPTLYETLKNQTILTYKPHSLNDSITLSKKNKINF